VARSDLVYWKKSNTSRDVRKEATAEGWLRGHENVETESKSPTIKTQKKWRAWSDTEKNKPTTTI